MLILQVKVQSQLKQILELLLKVIWNLKQKRLLQRKQ